MKPTAFLLLILAWQSGALAGQYKNFKVAVYIPERTTESLADPAHLQQDWQTISSQLKIDKVYLETYRDERSVDESTIEPIKKFFADHGVEVAGGITLAANNSGQFTTFSYADPKDRQKVIAAAQLAARHYNEVILDDFFFYNTKTDADIAAKGDKTWTNYRLSAMRDAAENLVVKPAKAVNPEIKMVIKFPNWYEHFQGSGYDLAQEPAIFDGIYTGTETRDPIMTDQLLQQYESYLVFRYFENIKPHGNGGGWVDTYSIRYADRYAEQLWDTMFAKAPEITLFNWQPLVTQEARPGERPWQNLKTNFDYNAMVKSAPSAHPTYARAAGYALEQVDAFLGQLGSPIGIKCYKPLQSTGEDFLPNYLGMIGIPIELQPTFPTEPGTVLLTQSAAFDPQIVAKIKTHLTAGSNVIITSGLLHALQGKGIEDIAEIRYTDHKATLHEFFGGYGAGNGTALNTPGLPTPAILTPEIRFLTNDSWALVRGVASGTGYPILLMNKYSKGVFYVLTIPDDFGDLYNLPQAAITAIKRNLLADFPMWTDSPAQVSLFAYDNNTCVVESFLPTETDANVLTSQNFTKLRDLVSDQLITGQIIGGRGRRGGGSGGGGAPRQPRATAFSVHLLPHSYRVFRLEP